MSKLPVKLIRKPSQWRAYVALTKYATIAATRNVATLVFGFLFPLVFITVFGLLGSSTTSIKLGIIDGSPKNNPIESTLAKIDIVTVSHGSKDALNRLLVQGKVDGVIGIAEAPGKGGLTLPHYAVTLTTSSGNISTSATAISLLRGVVDQGNLTLSGVTNPPIALSQVQTAGHQTRYIDFALPGQIGFSLLSTAIFGTVFGFISLKKTLVLKRMFATPMQALTFLVAQGSSRLFFALIQTVVIVGVGVLAFKFYLPHGWLSFAEIMFLAMIGLVAFLGFGYFLAGLANDENSAGPLVNLVTLPQFLLSGVFFPTDNFPSWVQPIANNLPLSYFNMAMRKLTTDGGNLLDTWP
jgi:ABC-2 type transport system permease protein